jgi:hypothetical protein
MNKTKIVVIVRGGVVQGAVSSSLEYPIELKVLDYDNYNVGAGDKSDQELKEFEEEIKNYYSIY